MAQPFLTPARLGTRRKIFVVSPSCPSTAETSATWSTWHPPSSVLRARWLPLPLPTTAKLFFRYPRAKQLPLNSCATTALLRLGLLMWQQVRMKVSGFVCAAVVAVAQCPLIPSPPQDSRRGVRAQKLELRRRSPYEKGWAISDL